MNKQPTLSSLCDSPARAIPLVPTALWIGSYLGALLLLKYLVLSPPLQIAVALLPIIPFVLFVRRFVLHLRNLDELHRRVHFEAFAIAFPLAILLLMTLGLLERAQLLAPEQWSYGQVWFYLPLFYFIGLAVSWRRYR
jgi:hypothetical protein